MTLDINFGYETEDIKLDGPNLDKSTGFEKGISRYRKNYSFHFSGEDFDPDIDITEAKHKFKAGDKIALIENYDWEENRSEFAGEIEFIVNTTAYYDEDNSGCVYFMLGKQIITFSGEYYPIEEKHRDMINKVFGTDYTEIFLGH